MIKEEWKNIPFYESFYEASNLGRIRSLDRVVNVKYNSKRLHKGRILKSTPQTSGHLGVVLCKYGKTKIFRVHTLIWLAFNGKIPTNLQMDHIDNNPTNNVLTNLRLCTQSQNNMNSIKRSKSKASKYKRIELDKRVNRWYTKICLDGKIFW